ncbi:hypothetical protein BJ742DRAFT_764716 [Cladochytrium replicatum]|nr:hypothetical protein BJ742DRAFT_764716 [Cladochytrium replicatum]
MVAMDVDRDVGGYLGQQRATAPQELRDYFTKFEEYYDRKLWHQLTLALESFVVQPSAGPLLIGVYENFVVDFEDKLNQSSLVQFVTRVSRVMPDPKQALTFLTGQAAKIKERTSENSEAYVAATMEAAHYQLVTGAVDECKAAMDQCEKILESLPSLSDPIIFASYYRVAAEYYRTKVMYQQFYHNALLYLSSVNLDDLSAQEKTERAENLAISALLGEGLYNFGELLMHPVLDSLTGTPSEWLRHLLFAFNTGDMDAYEKISKSPGFLGHGLLVNAQPLLRQKLCLMTLVESFFKKSKDERSKTKFQTISQETRVTRDEVEHLVMRALSLGLLKGKIDEVDGIVEVSWVQPRVLDKGQIKTLHSRLADWSVKVKDGVVNLELEEGGELFVQ